jgi:hypothetical protein
MEAAGLQVDIAKALGDIKRVYYQAMIDMEKLKNRLDGLQQELIEKHDSETFPNMELLDSVEERISELSDSLLIKSRKAWQTYNRLERKSKAVELEQPRLDELQSMCIKMEKLATDLLCYSLGRLKRTS